MGYLWKENTHSFHLAPILLKLCHWLSQWSCEKVDSTCLPSEFFISVLSNKAVLDKSKIEFFYYGPFCPQLTAFPYPLGPFWKDQFKSVTSERGSFGPCRAICLVKSIAHCFPLPPLTLQIKMNFSLVVAKVFLWESQLCAEKIVIYANCIPKGHVIFSPSIQKSISELPGKVTLHTHCSF